MNLHVLADTHTFFAVTPQMWLSTLWAKICNRGRLFYRLTLNFIVKKFPQCKTVNFIGNLIIINYPEHLFLHYHHYEKIFISTDSIEQRVHQYWYIYDGPISANNISRALLQAKDFNLLVAPEVKSGDHQHRWYSSSGDHEWMYKMLHQSIKECLHISALRWLRNNWLFQ